MVLMVVVEVLLVMMMRRRRRWLLLKLLLLLLLMLWLLLVVMVRVMRIKLVLLGWHLRAWMKGAWWSRDVVVARRCMRWCLVHVG